MDEPEPALDIALWTPSLTALFISSILSGAVIGAADGIALLAFTDGFDFLLEAGVVGGILGMVGGVLVLLVRRWIWGKEVTIQMGTILGLLYGVFPGIAILLLGINGRGGFGLWGFAGIISAFSMLGLLLGAILDRWTDAAVVWLKHRESP